MPKYYAVANGRRNGVYNSWSDCKEQVNGYSGSKYKSFNTAEEAQQYINSSNNALNMTLNSYRSSPYSRHSSYSSNSFKASNRLSNKSMDDSNERPIVYTDGACSRNGFKGAKGGIGVYWGEGHEDNLSEPLHGRQTNNRAEIQAAKRAIDQAKQRGYRKVTLRTDSNFLYKSQIHWKNKWKRNGWKTSNGLDVKNKEDFLELEEASHGIDINWEKVAAHRGIHGNEEADRLANQGMNMK